MSTLKKPSVKDVRKIVKSLPSPLFIDALEMHKKWFLPTESSSTIRILQNHSNFSNSSEVSVAVSLGKAIINLQQQNYTDLKHRILNAINTLPSEEDRSLLEDILLDKIPSHDRMLLEDYNCKNYQTIDKRVNRLISKFHLEQQIQLIEYHPRQLTDFGFDSSKILENYNSINDLFKAYFQYPLGSDRTDLKAFVLKIKIISLMEFISNLDSYQIMERRFINHEPITTIVSDKSREYFYHRRDKCFDEIKSHIK